MASKSGCYDKATEFLPSVHYPESIAACNSEQWNYEEERIKSFASWPVHYPVDPYRLAKAGFYFTGIEDEVICFSCHGHIKNWNYGDIVLKRHSNLFPDCDFIKNLSNNVPLVKSSAKSITQPLISESTDNVNTNRSNSDIVDFNKMKSESERLKTFSDKWTLSYVSSTDLAQAGFFYTGINDKVQCTFCKGIIGNWAAGSVPFQEHLRHFPWCDYVSKNITKAKQGQSWFQVSSQDVCGNMKPVNSSPNLTSSKKLINGTQRYTNLQDLGIQVYPISNPVHPEQAPLAARLRSFVSWPSNAPVSKEELAAAGFFYIGIDDRTICFHCNGGLCSWEEGDDPWVEHARWFPTCDYLQLNKGSDFMKACLVSNPSNVIKKNKSQQPCIFGSAEPILKKVDEAMTSNLVKHLLESEVFPSYIVRAAILLQIKQTGGSFSSTDDLCVAASYLKEQMENPSCHEISVKSEDLNICQSISEKCTISEEPKVTNKIWQNPDPVSHIDERKMENGSPKTSNLVEDVKSTEACLCKICMDKEVGVLFLPCGHVLACTACAPALKDCPMCREPIKATFRCYLN